jgi:ATP-dependent Zn protease
VNPPYDEATAFHEAGHAVVALALDRPVARVSVLPGGDFLGICHFAKGVFRPSKDWVEQEILISLGGIAAEARRTGEYAWDAAERDEQYALRLATRRAGERQADRLVRRLLAKVENLLADEDCWRAVEAIAAALLRTGVISGRAARHLYEQCVEAEE